MSREGPGKSGTRDELFRGELVMVEHLKPKNSVKRWTQKKSYAKGMQARFIFFCMRKSLQTIRGMGGVSIWFFSSLINSVEVTDPASFALFRARFPTTSRRRGRIFITLFLSQRKDFTLR